MTQEITLNANFDRAFALDQGGSYRYLVVDIQAAREALERSELRGSLNIALVIDRSGSMGGRPIEAAKMAAIGVAEGLKDNDRLSVVAFDSKIETLFKNISMNAEGLETARRAIGRLHERGTTDLAGGWLQGAEHVAETMEEVPEANNQVILLSDGRANQGITDANTLSDYARGLLERGIQTSTVGIGDHYSPELLQILAESGGGRMHDAELPEEIVEVVLAELGEVKQAWANQLQLDLSYPEGVVVDSFSNEPMRSESPGSKTFLLGSIVEGQSRRFVFQVRSGMGQVGERIEFDVQLSFQREGENVTASTCASLEFARRDIVKQQIRDIELSEFVANVWQSRLIRSITRINVVKDLTALDDLVSGEFKHFKRYCGGLPAGRRMVSNIDRLLSRARRPMKERSRKEMTLAAFKHQKGDRDWRSTQRDSWDKYIDR